MPCPRSSCHWPYGEAHIHPLEPSADLMPEHTAAHERQMGDLKGEWGASFAQMAPHSCQPTLPLPQSAEGRIIQGAGRTPDPW